MKKTCQKYRFLLFLCGRRDTRTLVLAQTFALACKYRVVLVLQCVRRKAKKLNSSNKLYNKYIKGKKKNNARKIVAYHNYFCVVFKRYLLCVSYWIKMMLMIMISYLIIYFFLSIYHERPFGVQKYESVRISDNYGTIFVWVLHKKILTYPSEFSCSYNCERMMLT